MTRTQIATADFSCGGMQKGTNGDESDERLRTENSYIDNRHKHTIIATLSVKKGSKFTDPDAQFPRGGALACARGFILPDNYIFPAIFQKLTIIAPNCFSITSDIHCRYLVAFYYNPRHLWENSVMVCLLHTRTMMVNQLQAVECYISFI